MNGALEVCVEIDDDTVPAGTAFLTQRGRGVSTAFVYERSYLARSDAYPLDPELPLYLGQQAVNGPVGAFSDCAPDRWGRNLITKRLRAEALREQRTPPTVTEVDYLTGVSDLTRQGALRFRLPGASEFVHPESEVPKLIDLPRLLNASDAIVRDPDDLNAIKDLLAAGTGTLGGARPKASVRDADRLFVAKFGKPDDQWEVMAWEKTALDLAQRAGIDVPHRRLENVDGRGVLLLERFDRDGARRVGYISAMTLMRARDGVTADYVELAEHLTDVGSNTSADLGQLWRRIAFSCLIHNTDDHLRNHGFLRHGRGWALSPVFDVNPNPDLGEGRQTAIGGAYYPDQEVNGLMAYASAFRLGDQQARDVLREVIDATQHWREVAAGNGVTESDANHFAHAFDTVRSVAQDAAITPTSKGARAPSRQRTPKPGHHIDPSPPTPGSPEPPGISL
jgi:serine/threonine-protein kinase HipA